MRLVAVPLLFTLLSVASTGYSFPPGSFPGSIGPDPALTLAGEIQTWTPDTMYEHVNGEAELLLRYGALNLAFVSYENETGDYVSVDILDLGVPINAYGLYRLYAGCDGDEQAIHGATVLGDDYTQYGFFGPYFLRINLDTGDDRNRGTTYVEEFLAHFTAHLPEPSSLPPALLMLQHNARHPCEVNYHPEHIDYDLETGPGYSWVGRDGSLYAVIILESEKQAALQSGELKRKGLENQSLYKNGVFWKMASEAEPDTSMKRTIEHIIDNS